jgi:hypothetical protein
LLNKGFPERELGLAMQKIFPSMDSHKVAKRVKPYMVGLGGQKWKHHTLCNISSHFSPYVHANPFQMSAMAKQDKNKSYLFSHAVLLFQFGLRVAQFTNDKLLTEPISTDEVHKQIVNIEGEISKYSSKNFPLKVKP